MKKNARVHRVGAITSGLSMIFFGTLFILQLFFNMISYEIILKLWPFILLGLGCEILISGILCEKFVYDKGAVFLMILVTLFAMCMGAADWYILNLGGSIIHL